MPLQQGLGAFLHEFFHSLKANQYLRQGHFLFIFFFRRFIWHFCWRPEPGVRNAA
jgi:hypothetical protein